MRRNCLTLFLLSLVTLANAQLIDHRIRLTINGDFNKLLGSFNHNQSDNYIYGQMKDAFGFSASVTQNVYKGWHVGVAGSLMPVNGDNKKIHSQILDHYNSAEPTAYFYNSFTNPIDFGMGVGQIGPYFSKVFIIGEGIELEPYVIMGFAGLSDISSVTMHRKKKDDNYSDDIILSSSTRSELFFYPTIGFTGNIRLAHILYLTGGFSYSTGSKNIYLTENRQTVYGDNTSNTTTYRQSVSCLQAHLGLQMRIGRYRGR